MARINIILRKPPYGTIDASEAIRHALGGITEEMSVNLVLIDGGVNAARKGQNICDTEYLSIEEGIQDCINMGVQIYAERLSLKEEGIETTNLINGIRIISSSEMGEILSSSDVTMIF